MFEWFRKLSPAFQEQVRKEKEQAAFAMFLKVPLQNIREVSFYKRDELTTDLICCEIDADEKTWFFHEEMEMWRPLMDHLSGLQDFDQHWIAKVMKPAFETCLYVAFRRTK